jgi:hypothetical protein
MLQFTFMMRHKTTEWNVVVFINVTIIIPIIAIVIIIINKFAIIDMICGILLYFITFTHIL